MSEPNADKHQMTLDEAAAELSKLCKHLPPGSVSVGIAEPDVLCLYRHRKKTKLPAPFSSGEHEYQWNGFTVRVTYVGLIHLA